MADVIIWENGKKVKRRYDPEVDAPTQPTPEQLEAEVQRLTDELMENNERDMALALATVDLAMAVRDGQLDGRDRAEVRRLFRDRVVFYLRQRRGV